MKNIVLYNAYAGNGTGADSAKNVSKFLEGEIEYVDMTLIDSYANFFSGVAEDDYVVICGGDGTINRFANDTQSIEIKVPIHYYPVGSGNDFWKDLGLDETSGPANITEYLKNLPIVEVKGKKYRVLNGVGYGIDGYCCEVGDRLRATSDKPINYTGIAIKGLLFHYKPTNAKVIVDGKEFDYKKVWIAPTMNGRFYGGGMMPTPGQDRLNKEGTLTCMIMYGAGRLPTLMAFPTIFKGEHVEKKMVATHVGKEITVKFDRPVALQVDGETILDVSEYTIKSSK